MEEKNNITTEDLARMIGKGFNGVDKRFDVVDEKFDLVDKRFDRIEDRLESIEKLILADHKRRIEKLEDEVKELKGLLAVK